MRASSMHSIELYLNRANGKKALNQKETNNNNNKNKTTTKIETFIRFNIAIMYDIKFYYYRRYGPSHSPFTFAVYPRLLSVAIVQKKNPFLTLDTHTHAQESFISNGHMGALCAYMYDEKYFKFFPYLFRVPCFEHPNWYSKWISIYSIAYIPSAMAVFRNWSAKIESDCGFTSFASQVRAHTSTCTNSLLAIGEPLM